MMNLYQTDGHLSEVTIKQLQCGSLYGDELTQALNHLIDCERCTCILTDTFPDTALADPPRALSANIKQTIRAKHISHNNLFYNLKIGFALCCSLLLLIAVPFSDIGHTGIKHGANKNHSSTGWFENVQTKFSDFSDTITQGGFFTDETTKK